MLNRSGIKKLKTYLVERMFRESQRRKIRDQDASVMRWQKNQLSTQENLYQGMGELVTREPPLRLEKVLIPGVVATLQKEMAKIIT